MKKWVGTVPGEVKLFNGFVQVDSRNAYLLCKAPVLIKLGTSKLIISRRSG